MCLVASSPLWGVTNHCFPKPATTGEVGEHLEYSLGPWEKWAALTPRSSCSGPEVQAPCRVLGRLQTFVKGHYFLSLNCVTQADLDSRFTQGPKMLNFCRKGPRIGVPLWFRSSLCSPLPGRRFSPRSVLIPLLNSRTNNESGK